VLADQRSTRRERPRFRLRVGVDVGFVHASNFVAAAPASIIPGASVNLRRGRFTL
jgi:hypothetical protein